MPRRANQAGQEMMKDLFLVEQRSADHIILSCVPAKRREENGADQDLDRMFATTDDIDLPEDKANLLLTMIGEGLSEAEYAAMLDRIFGSTLFTQIFVDFVRYAVTKDVRDNLELLKAAFRPDPEDPDLALGAAIMAQEAVLACKEKALGVELAGMDYDDEENIELGAALSEVCEKERVACTLQDRAAREREFDIVEWGSPVFRFTPERFHIFTSLVGANLTPAQYQKFLRHLEYDPDLRHLAYETVRLCSYEELYVRRELLTSCFAGGVLSDPRSATAERALSLFLSGKRAEKEMAPPANRPKQEPEMDQQTYNTTIAAINRELQNYRSQREAIAKGQMGILYGADAQADPGKLMKAAATVIAISGIRYPDPGDLAPEPGMRQVWANKMQIADSAWQEDLKNLAEDPDLEDYLKLAMKEGLTPDPADFAQGFESYQARMEELRSVDGKYFLRMDRLRCDGESLREVCRGVIASAEAQPHRPAGLPAGNAQEGQLPELRYAQESEMHIEDPVSRNNLVAAADQVIANLLLTRAAEETFFAPLERMAQSERDRKILDYEQNFALLQAQGITEEQYLAEPGGPYLVGVVNDRIDAMRQDLMYDPVFLKTIDSNCSLKDFYRNYKTALNAEINQKIRHQDAYDSELKKAGVSAARQRAYLDAQTITLTEDQRGLLQDLRSDLETYNRGASPSGRMRRLINALNAVHPDQEGPVTAGQMYELNRAALSYYNKRQGFFSGPRTDLGKARLYAVETMIRTTDDMMEKTRVAMKQALLPPQAGPQAHL